MEGQLLLRLLFDALFYDILEKKIKFNIPSVRKTRFLKLRRAYVKKLNINVPKLFQNFLSVKFDARTNTVITIIINGLHLMIKLYSLLLN